MNKQQYQNFRVSLRSNGRWAVKWVPQEIKESANRVADLFEHNSRYEDRLMLREWYYQRGYFRAPMRQYFLLTTTDTVLEARR